MPKAAQTQTVKVYLNVLLKGLQTIYFLDKTAAIPCEQIEMRLLQAVVLCKK